MMKKIFLVAGLLLAGAMTAGAKTTVDRMDPPMWWTGMENQQLQIMVTGEGIRDAVPSVDCPGVKLDSVARLDSPNYQFLYLTIGSDAKPGTVDITFASGKRKIKKQYELLARQGDGASHEGFDSSDVLYLMMPDRFADGGDVKHQSTNFDYRIDRTNPGARHGGTLKGISDHLDYLEELGVTAVWLTPVLENDMPGGCYHGYATTDYYRVDPRFGSNDDYRRLISECHSRGIKVVMDMIFNHCGLYHPWLYDLPSHDWLNAQPTADGIRSVQQANLTGKRNAAVDSLLLTNFRLNAVHDPYVSQYDFKHTVDGWFVSGMPDLNQRNPHLMTYLIQNSIWWIEYAGINGIRMDTYPYADMKAMARWNRAVAREYPRFNIVGESWLENEASIAYMQRGNKLNPVNTELPTVMDFPLCLMAQQAFGEQTKSGSDGLNRLFNHLALDMLYADCSRLLTFYDNHDTDRFLLEEPSDLARWKQAQAFLLTTRGIPQIYYGTEVLMHGSKAVTDGYVRLDMPGGFPGDSVSVFTADGRTPLQRDAFNFMSRLLHWRQGNKAVSAGTLRHFMPSNQLYVYERTNGDRRFIVLMNGTDEPLTDVDMSRYAEIMRPGDTFRDVITGDAVTVAPHMPFPARATLVLE